MEIGVTMLEGWTIMTNFIKTTNLNVVIPEIYKKFLIKEAEKRRTSMTNIIDELIEREIDRCYKEEIKK